MEIERKFLIDKFPSYYPVSECYAEQGYISTNPEVRIRKVSGGKNVYFYITFKSSGDLCREEVDVPIQQNDFNKLKKFIKYPLITKECEFYALSDGSILECSCVDKNQPTEFKYAEIEFKSVEDSDSFEIPNFLGKEITYDEQYKMKNYWVQKYEKI
jgi:CYTH domain-containing protein